jgi:hypothetical protein
MYKLEGELKIRKLISFVSLEVWETCSLLDLLSV